MVLGIRNCPVARLHILNRCGATVTDGWCPTAALRTGAATVRPVCCFGLRGRTAPPRCCCSTAGVPGNRGRGRRGTRRHPGPRGSRTGQCRHGQRRCHARRAWLGPAQWPLIHGGTGGYGGMNPPVTDAPAPQVPARAQPMTTAAEHTPAVTQPQHTPVEPPVHDKPPSHSVFDVGHEPPVTHTPPAPIELPSYGLFGLPGF